MRGLFFKIFIIFWIAQSLIFVISTALILRRRFFPSPDVMHPTLFNSLQGEANQALRDFERSGCGALRAYSTTNGQEILLEDAAGRTLCATDAAIATPANLERSSEITGLQSENRYFWVVPAEASNGQRYYLVAAVPHRQDEHSLFHDLQHFAFPQLPVVIAIDGATTFVLVLIFTRPVIRLRRAARELAQGNLRTRVQEGGAQNGIFRGDEFHALVRDFNHMAERLEGLVDAQKILLRDVSHELRSPLARLSVALELARADASEEMASHLDRIERETARLNELIGQLLALSSMEAVEGEKSFERVSLNQLLEQMIPDAEFEARQRQCSVAYHADGEIAIRGKRELLYRAIENVVRNAIRFTTSGSEVEIHLREERNGSRGVVKVEVKDRGPGIPEAEMDSIFRPFYRVDQARSPQTGGFGVGLAIAERAVKLHHGELKVRNRDGGGAALQMSFPAE
jgi:two-component system, OmpR family, sensor histidine kinase CpxA